MIEKYVLSSHDAWLRKVAHSRIPNLKFVLNINCFKYIKYHVSPYEFHRNQLYVSLLCGPYKQTNKI